MIPSSSTREVTVNPTPLNSSAAAVAAQIASASDPAQQFDDRGLNSYFTSSTSDTSFFKYPTPPTDTRNLLAFLISQDYACHGPLLSSGREDVKRPLKHFNAIRSAELQRRKSVGNKMQASGGSFAGTSELPSTPFRLVTPHNNDALEFLTPEHAYRFSNGQILELSTVLNYYSSIWEDIVATYASVVCKRSINRTLNSQLLSDVFKLPVPTKSDLLAALYHLFGTHQFVLTNQTACAHISPRARQIATDGKPLWQSNASRLSDSEQFQMQHDYAYLFSTFDVDDPLKQTDWRKEFEIWMQHQAKNPATATQKKSTTPSSSPAIAPQKQPSASIPSIASSAQVSTLAVSTASSKHKGLQGNALAVSFVDKNSPFLTPTSHAIARMLNSNTNPMPIQPQLALVSSLPPNTRVQELDVTSYTGSLPPPARVDSNTNLTKKNAAASSSATNAAPASATTTALSTSSVAAALPTKPTVNQTPTKSSMPSDEWMPVFRGWLRKNFESIPAPRTTTSTTIDAAVPMEDDLGFFIDKTGHEEAPPTAAPAAAIVTPHAPSAADRDRAISQLQSLFMQFCTATSLKLKRPKGTLQSTLITVINEVIGVKDMLLYRYPDEANPGKTLEAVQIRPKVGANPEAHYAHSLPIHSSIGSNTNSPAITVSSASPRIAAAASSSANLFQDLPPLESAAQVAASSSSSSSSLHQRSYAIGDVIDCRDMVDKWCEATIVNYNEQQGWRIHYTGWGPEWDEWVPKNNDRFAPRGTHVMEISPTQEEPDAYTSSNVPSLSENTIVFHGQLLQFSPITSLLNPTELNPLGLPQWGVANSHNITTAAIQEVLVRFVQLSLQRLPGAKINAETFYGFFSRDTFVKMNFLLFATLLPTALRQIDCIMTNITTDSMLPFSYRNNISMLLADSRKRSKVQSEAAAMAAEPDAPTIPQSLMPSFTPNSALVPPRLNNPLGLVSIDKDSIISNPVLEEVINRWVRTAYQPIAPSSTAKPISVQKLLSQFIQDTRNWTTIKVERFADLLINALEMSHPSVSRVMLMSERRAAIARRSEAVNKILTQKFATQAELDAANQTVRLEKKRKRDANASEEVALLIYGKDEKMETDSPSSKIPTKESNEPAAKKAKLSAPATPEASQVATVVSAKPSKLFQRKNAELSKIEIRLRNKQKSIALLREQIDALQTQLDKKVGKIDGLVERERSLREWVADETMRMADPNWKKPVQASAKPTSSTSNPTGAAAETRTSQAASESTSVPMEIDSKLTSSKGQPSFRNELGAPPALSPNVNNTPQTQSATTHMMTDVAPEPSSASVSVSVPAAAASSSLPPSGISVHQRGPAVPLSPPIIRDATVADALALSKFARQSFIDAFGSTNDPKHIEEYVNSTYSEEIQRSEIIDSKVRTFIADRDGIIVGFAMVRDGEVPECVKDRTALEIQRLYGVGVGSVLMRRCLDYANQLKRGTWLGVEGRNERAVNFYLKSGFVEVGTHTFQLGSDSQTDLVLERTRDDSP